MLAVSHADFFCESCAKRHGVKYIITRNVKDYNLSPVTAVEPADFIKPYGNKTGL